MPAGDHPLTSSDCGECHNTNTWDDARFVHDSSLTECTQCHAGDFRQSKHLKVEEPKLYYNLSELSNCAGSCHMYEDSSFTSVKEHRSGKHSTRKDGW